MQRDGPRERSNIFKKLFHLFIWLHRVLVVAHGTFTWPARPSDAARAL